LRERDIQKEREREGKIKRQKKETRKENHPKRNKPIKKFLREGQR